jgi:hypothetical protein
VQYTSGWILLADGRERGAKTGGGQTVAVARPSGAGHVNHLFEIEDF